MSCTLAPKLLETKGEPQDLLNDAKVGKSGRTHVDRLLNPRRLKSKLTITRLLDKIRGY